MSIHWVRVTPIENVPPREGRAVLIGGREIALFNLGDHFLATDNACPHQGGPLCDGIVTGSSVVCPLHAWKVNLASGQVERPTHGKDHCVSTYPARVEDGVVLIGLPATGAGTPEGVPYEDKRSTTVGHPFKGATAADVGQPFKGATAADVGHPFKGAKAGTAA